MFDPYQGIASVVAGKLDVALILDGASLPALR
jgi:hypothetical protein